MCQGVNSGTHLSIAIVVCRWQRSPVGSSDLPVSMSEIHNLCRNPKYKKKNLPLSRIMGWGEEERGDVITQIKPEDRHCEAFIN